MVLASKLVPQAHPGQEHNYAFCMQTETTNGKLQLMTTGQGFEKLSCWLRATPKRIQKQPAGVNCASQGPWPVVISRSFPLVVFRLHPECIIMLLTWMRPGN